MAASPPKKRRLAPQANPSAALRKKVSGQQLLDIYKRLANACDKNWRISDVLERFEEHASQGGRHPNHPMAVCFAHWADRMRAGTGLAGAMEGWVPKLHQVLIDAGETAGKPEQGLRNAVFHGESLVRMAKTVRKELTYPLGLLVAACAFLWVGEIFVGRALVEVIPKEQWGGGAALMIFLFDFAAAGGILYLFGFIAGLMLFLWWALPNWTGPLREKFDTYVPLFKEYRLLNGMGFVIALSGLLAGGANIIVSFSRLRENLSPWLCSYADRISGLLGGGTHLATAFSQGTPMFPHPELVRELAMAMDFGGSLEDILDLVEQWLDKVESQVKTGATIFKVIGFAAVAVVFIAIIGGIQSMTVGLTEMGNY